MNTKTSRAAEIDSLNAGVNNLAAIQKTFEGLANQPFDHQLQVKTKETVQALVQNLFNLGTDMNALLLAQGQELNSVSSHLQSLQTFGRAEHALSGMNSLQSFASHNPNPPAAQKSSQLQDQQIPKLPASSFQEDFLIHTQVTQSNLATISVPDPDTLFLSAPRPIRHRAAPS